MGIYFYFILFKAGLSQSLLGKQSLKWQGKGKQQSALFYHSSLSWHSHCQRCHCSSEWDPGTSNIKITWNLQEMQISEPSPDLPDQSLYFNTALWGFECQSLRSTGLLYTLEGSIYWCGLRSKYNHNHPSKEKKCKMWFDSHCRIYEILGRMLVIYPYKSEQKEIKWSWKR